MVVGTDWTLASCDSVAQAGSWQSPCLGSVLWGACPSSPFDGMDLLEKMPQNLSSVQL